MYSGYMKTTYTLVASKDAVFKNITRIASELIQDHPTSPLFVSLLRGAAPFSSRLMHQIVEISPLYHPELDYMTVSTYGNGYTAGQPHIVTDIAPSTEVQGRNIVILDDILDKGVTADFVSAHLQSKGAKEITLAVLCDKQTDRICNVKADYVGFTVEDAWLVGMGMDNPSDAKEAYRWTEEIWKVAQ